MHPLMFQDNLAAKATGGSDFDFLFPGLDPFDKGMDPTVVKAALLDIGKVGGILDPGDPRVTALNPLDAAAGNADNNGDPRMTVGFTFLGQFIDHDLTLDPSPLGGPASTKNVRTSAFDLDSVYGQGPDLDTHLYDRFAREPKFWIDLDAPDDLPRNSQGVALIGDPRNDENVIISQLHLAMLKFHNRVIEFVKKSVPISQLNLPQNSPMALFEKARDLVRWHYQWIVVQQFLKTTVGDARVNHLLQNGPQWFPAGRQFMPLEFTIAAYRFGHSQIRPGYTPQPAFGAPIFDPTVSASDLDPDDLRGGRRAPRRFVQWNIFFDFNDGQVKRNKLIDWQISSPMFLLPVGPGLPPTVDPTRTLAGRNLLRHSERGIPAGQDVAAHIKATNPLTAAELAALKKDGLDVKTPLWLYILKEAELREGGVRLGEVGGTIVAETFIGLLKNDPNSFLNKGAQGGVPWKPVLPRRNNTLQAGDFEMQDLLAFAQANIG
jgi:hypothetical protein